MGQEAAKTQRTPGTSPPEEALHMPLDTCTSHRRPSWPAFLEVTLLPGVIKQVFKNNFKQIF